MYAFTWLRWARYALVNVVAALRSPLYQAVEHRRQRVVRLSVEDAGTAPLPPCSSIAAMLKKAASHVVDHRVHLTRYHLRKTLNVVPHWAE